MNYKLGVELQVANSGVRRREALCLLFAVSVCVTPAIARPPQEPAGAQEQLPARVNPKAQELLDRAIQALGGSSFLAFKRMTTEGRLFAIEDESTVGFAPFQSYVEYPDKRRFSYGKTKPVILINNGDGAWEIDRYGLIRQPVEQARRWKVSNRYSMENLMRLRIHDPGVLIQEAGVDFVDNVRTLVVDIVEADGAVVKLYLNRQNYLPVQISYQARDPRTHELDEYWDVYADYKDFGGVNTARHLTRFQNGDRASEIFRRTVKYDEIYPAGYFQPTG